MRESSRLVKTRDSSDVWISSLHNITIKHVITQDIYLGTTNQELHYKDSPPLQLLWSSLACGPWSPCSRCCCPWPWPWHCPQVTRQLHGQTPALQAPIVASCTDSRYKVKLVLPAVFIYTPTCSSIWEYLTIWVLNLSIYCWKEYSFSNPLYGHFI